MLDVNGVVKYEFEDLVKRSGYTVAREVFAEIVTTTDFWINPETGETGSMAPERINESCLFDEVGWADLCARADEISASSWGKGRVGNEIWNLYHSAGR